MVTLPRKKKKLDLHVQFPAGQRTHVRDPRSSVFSVSFSPFPLSLSLGARVQRMERISNVIGVPFYVREAQLPSSFSTLP